MKKSELKSIINEVVSEIYNENPTLRTQHADDDKNKKRLVAVVDNNVFPMGSDEIEKEAKRNQLSVWYVGDAQFGTESLSRYRIILSGDPKKLYAFEKTLSKEKGIEFFDSEDNANKNNVHGSLKEVGSVVPEIGSDLDWWQKHVEKIAQEIKSRLGKKKNSGSFSPSNFSNDKGPFSKMAVHEVGNDFLGVPDGYKFLGTNVSDSSLPVADDWIRVYVSQDGNTEKFVSPKLKAWYEIDSSG